MTIRPATPADLPALTALLNACGLNGEGIEPGLADWRVATQGDEVAGAAGLERCGDRLGLLRSVAVLPDRRGQGVARSLCAAVQAHAEQIGIERLYLLTTTAAGFFAGLGYRSVPRTEAPPAIQATEQFRNLCPATAVLMSRRLAA